jgi:hypothetical protein
MINIKDHFHRTIELHTLPLVTYKLLNQIFFTHSKWSKYDKSQQTLEIEINFKII